MSHYPYADGPDATAAGELFAIENLPSIARAASDVAAWLLQEYRNPDAPLASLRVLLSPVPGEEINPSIRALMDPAAPGATRAAVEQDLYAFEVDCRTDVDNVVVVYIAGHGIRTTTRGSIVLLEDVGNPAHRKPQEGSIDVAGCHRAFQRAGSPNRQLWIADACRTHNDAIDKLEMPDGFLCPNIEKDAWIDGSRLILAASTGQSAYADERGTIFSAEMLTGLRGGALSGPDARICDEWHVSVFDLFAEVYKRVIIRARVEGYEQSVDQVGGFQDVVIQRFPKPPDVDVEFNLTPGVPRPVPKGYLNRRGARVGSFSSWPVKKTIPAGLYTMTVRTRPPVPCECMIDYTPYVANIEVG